MKQINVGTKIIGDNAPCFIVAEVGINHNGNANIAKKLIDVAKEIGVDAVKFQTYRTQDFVSDPKQIYTYRSQGKIMKESMFKMFERYEFSKKEWVEIIKYCRKKRMIFFSTPQNPSDLDFLLKITNLPVIKVGSDDLTNLGLLKYYSCKNKPMIISTGMAFISEIENAIAVIRKTENNNLVVLHCISSYPAQPEEVNLRKMFAIKQKFDVIVGFSDHTQGITASIAAAALGAKVIEKHFTLAKTAPGPDHWFSADPKELRALVEGIRYVEKILGSNEIGPTSKEMKMRKIARRSIVAARDIKRGEIITQRSISYKRPGTGLPPKLTDLILGKQAKTDIEKDSLITTKRVI